MTESQIKEALSRHFFGAIACCGGYVCTKPEADYGVDLFVSRQLTDVRGDTTRYWETGEQIHIQLKATIERQVIRDADSVRYDLEAKTYNDLVRRQGSATPLLLVLLVLPDERTSWIEITADELRLRRHAYWWVPSADADFTDNDNTIRIRIPVQNTVTGNFLSDRFAEAFA